MSNAPKVQYTEVETAAMLGVTVDRLRSLVRDYIVKDASDEWAVASYRACDLVMLRVLARTIQTSVPADAAHA